MMTFCVKVCLGIGMLLITGFRTKLFGNMQSYAHCQRQKCNQETPVSGDKFYVVIHWDSPKRERQTGELC